MGCVSGTCGETEEVHTGFWLRDLREEGQFGRPRHRWQDNNQMDLQGMRWKDMDWIYFAPG